MEPPAWLAPPDWGTASYTRLLESWSILVSISLSNASAWTIYNTSGTLLPKMTFLARKARVGNSNWPMGAGGAAKINSSGKINLLTGQSCLLRQSGVYESVWGRKPQELMLAVCHKMKPKQHFDLYMHSMWETSTAHGGDGSIMQWNIFL